MEFYVSKNLPIVQIQVNPQGETITPDQILSHVAQWRESGVSLELSGHFILSQDLEFIGYRNLQIVAKGMAIIEQQHNYNDASPMALTNCENVTLSNLILLGSGAERADGSPSEQNGIV